MDERVHFASLLFASHMGILGKSEVIGAADQRIVELEKPEYCLIELSTEGDSGELERLIVSADERVYLEVHRVASSSLGNPAFRLPIVTCYRRMPSSSQLLQSQDPSIYKSVTIGDTKNQRQACPKLVVFRKYW